MIAHEFHFHLAVLEDVTLLLFHLYILELKSISKDKWWIRHLI